MIFDWRASQRRMFGDAELEQDARIKDFFADCNHENTLLHGDTKYFEHFFPNHSRPYHNGLVIFNSEIEIGEMITVLRNLNRELKVAGKICVAVNKFCVYSAQVATDTSDDYDTALIGTISSCLDRFRPVTFIFDKDLKGDRFNFASPYTQIYFENANS
jgi:hypothetical protein